MNTSCTQCGEIRVLSSDDLCHECAECAEEIAKDERFNYYRDRITGFLIGLLIAWILCNL